MVFCSPGDHIEVFVYATVYTSTSRPNLAIAVRGMDIGRRGSVACCRITARRLSFLVHYVPNRGSLRQLQSSSTPSKLILERHITCDAQTCGPQHRPEEQTFWESLCCAEHFWNLRECIRQRDSSPTTQPAMFLRVATLSTGAEVIVLLVAYVRACL